MNTGTFHSTVTAVRRAQRQLGASLIEAAIAIVVLAVAFIGSASFLYHAYTSIHRAAKRSLATEACVSRLEELTSVAYNNLQDYAESEQSVELDHLSGQRTTEITDIDEDADGTVDYRKITVTLDWTSANGTAQSVDTVTLRWQ